MCTNKLKPNQRLQIIFGESRIYHQPNSAKRKWESTFKNKSATLNEVNIFLVPSGISLSVQVVLKNRVNDVKDM